MSKESPEVAKALEKCKEFDEKYFTGWKSIEFALKSLQNSVDFVKIVNDPMLEGFFAKNQKRGDKVFETGFNHATRQIPDDLKTQENIRKLICLIDLSWDAIDADSKAAYDWTTNKNGIPTDFQMGPFFGNVFKTQKELDAAFANQLNSIKASTKDEEIKKLSLENLVENYVKSGKFGLKVDEKREEKKEDADLKSKKSGIHGDKSKIKQNFGPTEKKEIIKCIADNRCTVKENNANSMTAIDKDGKEVCTITPNEVVVSGNDYKLAILIALINFPNQELVFSDVPAAEKPKFIKAFKEAKEEFKDTHPDVRDDIKYVFENEVSKPDKNSKKDIDLEKKYPEVKQTRRDGIQSSLTGGNGSEWYYNNEVRDIISATEHAAGQNKHRPAVFLCVTNNQKISSKLEVNKYNKIYFSVTPQSPESPFSTDDCKMRVKAAASEFIRQWNIAHPDNKDRGTLVFSIHVGGNHYATYACNTDGEILVISPMNGYEQWDKAAVEGLTEALSESKNKIEPKKPIYMTPVQDDNFRQKDVSICGAISAAMSVAISSEHTFEEQRENLENHMSKLCGKDTKHYPEIRKEHQMLINIYKTAIEPSDSKRKEEGEEDIRDYLETCQYHKPSVHIENLSPRMTSTF